jgi:CheY-like chemotaxis protein
VIVKDLQSVDRLLDETALFLHRIESQLPDAQRSRLQKFHETENPLAGRQVLVIDDDIRNIFALTSMLEQYGMDVVFAENGQEGIERLASMPGVDVVLMDVMMPGMDGYEAMRVIRRNLAHKSLPIIAVTAKAMKGDREKCIEAGASDYLAKPINPDQLLSLLRVWLRK